MRIDILTLFPEMFQGPFGFSLFQRAVEQGLVTVRTRQLRDFTHDRHRTVDDAPYGGGAGMVLKPEPIFEGVAAMKAEIGAQGTGTEGTGDIPVILLSARGRLFSQKVAFELSRSRNLILICGRYEGVDERVAEHLATDEISIGDYILSGGELPAMVVVDAVVRLIPGVLGKEESVWHDSHVSGRLQYPQYTRPPDYRGWEVPAILLSGNHAEIDRWRREQALKLTAERRPDLLGPPTCHAEP